MRPDFAREGEDPLEGGEGLVQEDAVGAAGLHGLAPSRGRGVVLLGGAKVGKVGGQQAPAAVQRVAETVLDRHDVGDDGVASEDQAGQGVPAEAVRSYADSAADPHVQARDMLQPVKDARGQTIPVTGPAAKLSRTPTKVRHAAPDLGADTDAILDELGYDDQARRRLREDGVV